MAAERRARTPARLDLTKTAKTFFLQRSAKPPLTSPRDCAVVPPHPAARFGYKVSVGRSGAPRGPLFGAERTPTAGDSADVVAVALLLGGAWIAGAHELACDLAVTGVETDNGALPARLWNGAGFHIVSGTRILRCWFSRLQLGGCVFTIATPGRLTPAAFTFARRQNRFP